MINALRDALYWLERRAAKVRGDLGVFDSLVNDRIQIIETLVTCDRCGHIACTRSEEQHV